jgi:uncharacterized damage-inducible protein DinB
MTDFEAAVRGFAELDEGALGRPWPWRDGRMEVRYALYGTLEEAQAVHLQAVAEPHPESRRIVALAQRAFGDLRGLLTGLPTDLLDAVPRAGEWSVRETLRHVLSVERRYATQTLYAVGRADAEPVRIAEERLPTTAAAEVAGEIDAILARLGEARAETNRRLGDLTPAAMARPTVWVKQDVDVRFRLYRIAAHVTEHTIQCEKTLVALGWPPTEGRRIVRHITAVLGEIEGLGAATGARALETRLAERWASVTTALAAG